MNLVLQHNQKIPPWFTYNSHSTIANNLQVKQVTTTHLCISSIIFFIFLRNSFVASKNYALIIKKNARVKKTQKYGQYRSHKMLKER